MVHFNPGGIHVAPGQRIRWRCVLNVPTTIAYNPKEHGSFPARFEVTSTNGSTKHHHRSASRTGRGSFARRIGPLPAAEDPVLQECEYRYFAIKDDRGDVCAIHSFFILDQDFFVDIGPKMGWWVDTVRACGGGY
jgi:hypothetical protein